MVYSYTDDEWSVFLQFPREVKAACPFVEVFLGRLEYFLEVSRSDYEVPLPAILRIE